MRYKNIWSSFDAEFAGSLFSAFSDSQDSPFTAVVMPSFVGSVSDVEVSSPPTT